MTLWVVTSPPYPYREYDERMLAQTYDIVDCDEFEAPTRREAVQIAVRQWLNDRGSYAWQRKNDGLCPWTGIRAQSIAEMKAEAFAAGPPDAPAEPCDHDAAWCAGPVTWVWFNCGDGPEDEWGWMRRCRTHGYCTEDE